jgi:hypothetical protein
MAFLFHRGIRLVHAHLQALHDLRSTDDKVAGMWIPEGMVNRPWLRHDEFFHGPSGFHAAAAAKPLALELAWACQQLF